MESDWREYSLVLGGYDADPGFPQFAEATNRPLYRYLGKSQVLRCPADKGQAEGDIDGLNGNWKPSNFEALGCSYRFNTVNWGNEFFHEPVDVVGLSGKKESWVPDPSRFIVLHEPPAFWYANYYHWHYARGPTTVDPNDLAGDHQKFISPILFADGHSANHDFTRALKDDPVHPIEPTKDWIWYKPME